MNILYVTDFISLVKTGHISFKISFIMFININYTTQWIINILKLSC